MRNIFVVLSVVLLLTACSNQTGSNNNSNSSNSKKEPYYPFPQYIKEQLAYVDSMPLAVERIVVINDRTVDSGFIDKASFKQSVIDFATIDPNNEKWKNSYEEESFNDLTLNTITFSITATDTLLPLQQADILLNPETKKVKNIFLKRYLKTSDSTVNQTVLWVHNMRCQVGESIALSSGKQYTKKTTYIWDRPIK